MRSPFTSPQISTLVFASSVHPYPVSVCLNLLISQKMNSAFVSPLAVSTKPSLGKALCSTHRQTASAAEKHTNARANVTMAVQQKKDQSLMDWLHDKFMHNALWEGDKEAGYELYFKEAMDARDDLKKQRYDDMKNGGN